MSSDRENGHDQTKNDQLNTKRSMKSDTEIQGLKTKQFWQDLTCFWLLKLKTSTKRATSVDIDQYYISTNTLCVTSIDRIHQKATKDAKK